MPSLHEVCVWYNFNIDSINVDTTDSPYVFFTECYTPEITALDSLYQPEIINVTSSEDGMIFLVPKNTERVIEVIRRASIDSAMAVANIPASVSLSGLENGWYWLYARNETGKISELSIRAADCIITKKIIKL
jgi:hypothetical protein